MERLVHLVHCLKPHEIQFVRDFYKVRFNGSDNKRLQLFELILKKKACNNLKACVQLYKGKPGSAFCHLKKKLEEDLLNFILLSPQNSNNLSQEFKEEINCRKTFLQSKILLSRGIHEEGISLLQKTARLAERYEFPDLKLTAYDILRKYKNVKRGLKTHKYYNDHIKKAFNVFHKILQAKEMKFSPFDTHSDSSIEGKNFIGKQLQKMSNGYQPAESKRAYFWYGMALIDHYFREQNYVAVKDYTLHLIQFIQSEPVLDCPSKKGEVYLKLAESYIRLGDYQQAINPAKEALHLYAGSEAEYMAALRILFFAYYRNHDFMHADHMISQALYHKSFKSSHPERWILLQAAVKFSGGQFLEVRKCLNCAKKLQKQGITWAMGHRLLELLNILELQDYDWFEYKIESFRKKLSSMKSQSCPRLPEIYTILKTLMNTNYHYFNTTQILQDNLALINQACWNWDPMGYELVNLGHWLTAKAYY